MANVMQVVNLASYALVAAIGVSALVTTLSDKAVASPAPVVDAGDTFIKNMPKGWMLCKGQDSDNIETLLRIKFTKLASDSILVNTQTMDKQNNNPMQLIRSDNDRELATFGNVATPERNIKVVTNLVSYGPVKETVLASTVYADEDNSTYTVFFNLANCIKADK